MAKPPAREKVLKKKACAFCKDKSADQIDYKDTATAAQVRQRPRQDPRPASHGQLRPAPARHRGGGQELA